MQESVVYCSGHTHTHTLLYGTYTHLHNKEVSRLVNNRTSVQVRERLSV